MSNEINGNDFNTGYKKGIQDTIETLDGIIGVMDSFTQPKMKLLLNIIKEHFGDYLSTSTSTNEQVENIDFTFKWGKDNDEPTTLPHWRTPGIMDGGYKVHSIYRNLDDEKSVVRIYFSKISFANDTILDGIEIPIKKGIEYHVSLIDKKLYCKENFIRLGPDLCTL